MEFYKILTIYGFIILSGQKYCPAKPIERAGTCHDPNAQQECINLILGEYGASQRPRATGCKDLGNNKSLCLCEIIC